MTQYHPLGYRVLVEPLNLCSLEDSALWTPPETRQKFKACRVVQLGDGFQHGRKKRPPMEISEGQCVLVDLSMGHKDVELNGRQLKLVSYHDVVARIEHQPESAAPPTGNAAIC